VAPDGAKVAQFWHRLARAGPSRPSRAEPAEEAEPSQELGSSAASLALRGSPEKSHTFLVTIFLPPTADRIGIPIWRSGTAAFTLNAVKSALKSSQLAKTKGKEGSFYS